MEMKKKSAGMISIMAAALAATSAAAQEAPREPIKVGIIDTSVKRLMMAYQGVGIEVKTFIGEGLEPGTWQAVPGHTHGDVVASSFVEQSRVIDKKAPIVVYSANAFFQHGPRNPDGNRAMSLDFEGAEKALQWFHDNGVRTVVTAFYTKDSPSMRSFMQKAKDLDIVLFAGTNNDKTKVIPFPARDPYSITVTGSNANLDFANNQSMSKWTAFKMNGDTPTNALEPTEENGSSFAVARAAAFGAHYVRTSPAAGRDEVADAMTRASGGVRHDGVCDLNDRSTVGRFRKELAALATRIQAPVRMATVTGPTTPLPSKGGRVQADPAPALVTASIDR